MKVRPRNIRVELGGPDCRYATLAAEILARNVVDAPKDAVIAHSRPGTISAIEAALRTRRRLVMGRRLIVIAFVGAIMAGLVALFGLIMLSPL